MILSVLTCVLVLAVVAAHAQTVMDAAAIRTLLNDRIVTGEKDGRRWSQLFNANGTTRWSSGRRVSFGEWRLEGNRYCSVWPPETEWECWRVEGVATAFTFVSERSGDRWLAEPYSLQNLKSLGQ